MRILITGANSFVGTSFRQYSQFRNVDEIPVFNYKRGDIDFSNYDVVLHLAAIVHHSDKITENEYLSVNRDLSISIATDARIAGVKQFLFLSTVKVYGDSIPDNKIRNEHSECFPDDAYGKSKLEAETGLKKLENNNFKVSIVRTPLVYGEGVQANMKSLIKLVNRVPVLPFKDMNNTRNFTYIENLVGFIDQIIIKGISGVFIAMDSEAISTTRLVTYISNSIGKKVTLFKLPELFVKMGTRLFPKIFERLYGSLEFDNAETLSKLNYVPPFSTEEGIRKMIHSFKNSKSD